MQRQYLLRLHFVVLAAIFVGLLESAVFFGTYSSKNEVRPPSNSLFFLMPPSPPRPHLTFAYACAVWCADTVPALSTNERFHGGGAAAGTYQR